MSNKITIRGTKKYGRGLYAASNINKGEIIEVSPVVPMTKFKQNQITATFLNLYVFGWGFDGAALALGVGSLFNHSSRANVRYLCDIQRKEMTFLALKPIKKGQQLFINYGYTMQRAQRATDANRLTKINQLEKQVQDLERRAQRSSIFRELPQEDKAEAMEAQSEQK